MRPTRLISYSLVLAIFLFTGFSTSKKTSIQNSNQPTNIDGTEKTRILAASEWMVQETIQNLECKNVHYIRDEINETGYDQGSLRLKFNEDGTGTFLNTDGNLYELQWKFSNKDYSSMNIRIAGLLEHNWKMVVITEEFIMETAKLDGIGLVTAKWIPVKTACSDLTAKK